MELDPDTLTALGFSEPWDALMDGYVLDKQTRYMTQYQVRAQFKGKGPKPGPRPKAQVAKPERKKPAPKTRKPSAKEKLSKKLASIRLQAKVFNRRTKRWEIKHEQA